MKTFECHLCHRIGTHGFTPWGSEGWECANDRACARRRRERNHIVIHRDNTFEYHGEKWHVSGGSPGTPNADWGYELWRDRDGASANAGSLFRMADVRAYLRESAEHDWSLVDEQQQVRAPQAGA